MLIELPSGLKGNARKLRGSSAVVLAERATTNGGSALGNVLRGCWVETTDPGPYSHAAAGSAAVDWTKVLKGDLLAGLIDLRVRSIPSLRGVAADDPAPGKQYDFYVQCERCKRRYGWSIPDMRELTRQALSEESAAKVRAGDAHAAACTDEEGNSHEITFDLMLPSQDDVLSGFLKPGMGRKRVTPVETLAAQTRTIDGKPKSPILRQKFFEGLDFGEINRLRDLFDESDCGVNSDIMTTCDKHDCEWEQETSLPFGKTFWRPEIPKAPVEPTGETETAKD